MGTTWWGTSSTGWWVGFVYRWRKNNRITEIMFCSEYSTPVKCKNNIYSFCDSLTGLYMCGCILILPVIGNHISRGIGQMVHVRISQHWVKFDQLHTDICPISLLV